MIPITVESVAIFTLLLAPGFTYTRVTSRTDPGDGQSGVAYVLQILVGGGFFSALAVLTLLLFVAATSSDAMVWLSRVRAQDTVAESLLAEPTATLVFVAATFGLMAVSHLYAWVGARLLNRVRAKDIRRTWNVWSGVFSTAHPSNDVMVTVRLSDGRTVSGLVHAYTIGTQTPVAERELVLRKPVFVEPDRPDEQRHRLPLDFFFVRADTIAEMGAKIL